MAILLRQDVFAELKGRALRRRPDAAGDDRLAARQHARAQHRYAQLVKLVRRIRSWLASGGHAADMRIYAITAWQSSSLKLPALV